MFHAAAKILFFLFQPSSLAVMLTALGMALLYAGRRRLSAIICATSAWHRRGWRLEGRSRNTFENALFTRNLVAPQPGSLWLLVTSASHMPRAVGVFRQAGFDVLPYPVDFRTRDRGDMLLLFSSIPDGLKRCDLAAREWLGLLMYWLTGRSSSLFPAP